MSKKYSSVKDFLAKKEIEISFKRYGIDVLGSMAMGLFASLLVGTILNTIGLKLGIPFLSEVIWPIAKEMTGPAIAVAIAMALKAPNLVVFSSLVVGYAGNQLGGPAGAWIAAWLSVELGKVVSKETKIDIIITPALTIISGVSIGTFLGPVINYYACNNIAAILDGNYYFGNCWYSAYLAYKFSSTLYDALSCRTCRWSSNSRLQCSDDRFCCNKF